MRPAGTTGAVVTVGFVGRALRCSDRWARKKYISAWFALRDSRPDLPRVMLLYTRRPGRPSYVIERSSFERWFQRYSTPSG